MEMVVAAVIMQGPATVTATYILSMAGPLCAGKSNILMTPCNPALSLMDLMCFYIMI